MTDSQTTGIALASSQNRTIDQRDTSEFLPLSTSEIPSTAESQESSNNDSLNSQDTALSMSQATSVWIHEEPKLTVDTHSQRSHPIEVGVLDPEKIRISDHVREGPGKPQPGQNYSTIQSSEHDLLNSRPRAVSSARLSQGPRSNVNGNQPHRLDTAAGQKRTSSGHIKTPNSSTSPHEANAQDYPQMVSENLQSSPRKSPQISQMTAQLRTRLSYAMVKVQKGWESKNITEVETLAAQQNSPVSASLESERTHDPLATRIAASPERPIFMYSDIRSQLSPQRDSIPSTERPSPIRLSSSSSAQSDKLQPLIEQVRELPPKFPPPSKRNGPSLAPPVDISPRNPRRSNPPIFEASKLTGNGIKGFSNLSGSSASASTTPPALYLPLVSTPNQQKATAMEQDAIETLLFMSSPGNSQYKPPSQPRAPGSPLRTVLSPEKRARARTLELDKALRPRDDEAVPLSPRKRNFLDSVNLENSENIDKVLDRMPVEDSSSSDEDVMILDGTPV